MLVLDWRLAGEGAFSFLLPEGVGVQTVSVTDCNENVLLGFRFPRRGGRRPWLELSCRASADARQRPTEVLGGLRQAVESVSSALRAEESCLHDQRALA